VTIAFVGGTGVSTTGAAKGTTSTTVVYNNVAAGRLALLTVGAKPNTGTITTPSGWTKIGEQTGGTGTNAADTGLTKVAIYAKELDGTETGSVTVNGTSTGSIQGSMDVYSKTRGFWDYTTFVAGSDAAHGTNFSAAGGTWSNGGLEIGDVVFVGHSGDTDDSTTATSAPAITQTGITFGTAAGRSQVRNTSGNQGMTYTWSNNVTAVATPGTSNTLAPTATFTWSVSSCGPAMMVRIREFDNFASLVDTFSSGTALDSANWTVDAGGGGGGITVGSGVATIDITGGAIFKSAKYYRWAGSEFVVEIPQYPTGGNGYYAGVKISRPGQAGDFVGFYAHGDGTLTLENKNATDDTITLNTTNHRWGRLKHDGTNVTIDVSPNGTSWTTVKTILAANLASWNTWTALQVWFEGADGVNSWIIDNVNNPPSTTPVSGTMDLQWKVLNTVTGSTDLRWAVQNTISGGIDLRWSVLAPISGSLDLRWAVLAPVSGTMDLRWAVRNTVASGLDLRWAVLAQVSGNVDLRWAVRSLVSGSTDLRWAVLNSVTGGVDLRWAVRALVSGSTDLRWAVLNTVNGSLDLRWIVNSSLTPVSGTLDLQWAVRNAVSGTTDLRWAVRNQISSTLDLRWAVLAAVAGSIDLRWAVRALVTGTLDLRWAVISSITPVSGTLDLQWAVRNLASGTLNLPWAVRNAVAGSVDLRWAVRSAVAGTLDLRWKQLQTVNGVLDLRWATAGRVSGSLDLQWAVRNAVSGTLSLPWAVRSQISGLLDVPWRVRARITGAMQLLWVVEGVEATLPPAGHVAATLTDRVTVYFPDQISASQVDEVQAYLGSWP
jgi:hypothetical protein